MKFVLHPRVCTACVLACFLAIPAEPPAARATEPRVAGLNELVISDPGLHELGLPAVQFKPTEDGSGIKVEIPPKVHTHRFYYSGDREFQGPLVVGGPTIVIANHPHTGERKYIDVMLPSGAPIIAYDKDSITYVYPHQRVVIKFCWLPCDRVLVTYLPGHGVDRRLHEITRTVKANTKEKLQKSKLVGTVKTVTRETGEVIAGASSMVVGAANSTVETAKKVITMVPGVQALQSQGKQLKEQSQVEAVKQAGMRLEQQEQKFIPTIR